MPEENLFTDFKSSSLSEWLDKIEKDLKGKSVDSLQSQLEEGITVNPVYMRERLSNTEDLGVIHSKGWQVVQEILVLNEREDNKKILDYLNKGATSLLFYLKPEADLKVLLDGVLIEHVHINFVTEGNGMEVWEKLKSLIEERGLSPDDIKGSINIDCLENLARTGNWFKDEASDFDEIKKLTQAAPQNLKGIGINANLFANAGANHSQQLGIALSMAYEYIHRLQLSNTESFWFNFAVGSHYFGEIAKLRAFRKLWTSLQAELKLDQNKAHIYCENSQRNKSKLDKYNNLIRSTAETMAAVIGGCDELSIKPLTVNDDNSETLESRISRNQQLVAQHEAHLNAVKDIAKGSYLIEDLTEKLARKGWEFFKEIEKQGGYLEALKKGWLQQKIEKVAQHEQNDFHDNNKVLIGVNKYRKDDEKDITPKPVDRPNKDSVVKPVFAKRLAKELEG